MAPRYAPRRDDPVYDPVTGQVIQGAPPRSPSDNRPPGAPATGTLGTPGNTTYNDPANPSDPQQPPYSGAAGPTNPGASAGWSTVVSQAQQEAQAALAQQPEAGDYGKIDDPNTKRAYVNAQVQQATRDIATTQTAYQQAVTAFNALQTKAQATDSGSIVYAEALKNAQMAVDNTYAAWINALSRKQAWQGEMLKLLPSDDPNVVAANEATLVEDHIRAKKARLEYDIYSGHAGTAADQAARQTELDTASKEMDNELKRHNMDRVSKDDTYTDALRQQQLDVGAYGPAAAQADIDYKAGLTEQAQGSADQSRATADSTRAGIPGVVAAGDLTQQYVDAGYGTAATEGLQATTAGTVEDTRGTKIANDQTEAGPDATFIGQLGKAIADPTNSMNATTAADLYFNHVYGGSQYERRQEANKQAAGQFSTMAQAGMVVSPGQQYIRGAEPGGTFQNVMGRLGNTGYNPQPIQRFSAPAFAQAAGIDISPTQGLPTQSPFTAEGGANPQFQSPNMAGNSPGFAGQVGGAKQPLVLGNMTPREYKAMLAQQGGVQ